MTSATTAPRLHPSPLGATAGPLEQSVDARWLMAYAAGLGETDPRYYETRFPAGPLAHLLFPVCYEWPLAVDLRARVIGEAIAPLGVHATHDLLLHRPPRAGDRLTTTARVVGVERRRAGALVSVRFDTVDAAGAPVSTTHYGSLYRGVSLDGEETRAPRDEPPDPGGVRWEDRVDVPATAAHVYTECARIWNPIHTDAAVAQAAGLPRPILHGTATLGLAVSRVVARDLGGDPTAVRRVRARFSGMVAPPSVVVVRGRGAGGSRILFEALDGDGRPVLDGGSIER